MSHETPFYVGVLFLYSPFGNEFLKRLNQLPPFLNKKGEQIRIVAEHLPIQEIEIQEPIRYHLIIDRISYLLKHSVGILMNYAFRGVHIINNPFSFHYFLEQKDAGYSLASALGIPVPKTFILPTFHTPRLFLDDFKYHRPLQWGSMLQQVKLPCILKPAGGRGGKDVFILRTQKELLDIYERSNSTVMMLQEKVKTPHDWQLRCICIGKQIIICKYRFGPLDTSKYLEDTDFLSPDQFRRVIDTCRILNRIHGYEMNSIEFILDSQGTPWAIDFNNPIPDGRREALGELYYEQYQNAMIEMVKEIAFLNAPSYFLPDLNPYSKIAQLQCSPEEKFAKALDEANKYYEDEIASKKHFD
ncbi:MAG: hypothetical protein AABZ60_13630 [Planctomycetota bacterium]